MRRGSEGRAAVESPSRMQRIISLFLTAPGREDGIIRLHYIPGIGSVRFRCKTNQYSLGLAAHSSRQAGRSCTTGAGTGHARHQFGSPKGWGDTETPNYCPGLSAYIWIFKGVHVFPHPAPRGFSFPFAIKSAGSRANLLPQNPAGRSCSGNKKITRESLLCPVAVTQPRSDCKAGSNRSPHTEQGTSRAAPGISPSRASSIPAAPLLLRTTRGRTDPGTRDPQGRQAPDHHTFGCGIWILGFWVLPGDAGSNHNWGCLAGAAAQQQAALKLTSGLA